MNNRIQKKRIQTLFAGVLHYMCLGLMYSWSKFAGQIRMELGFDHGQITLAYSLCMAMFTLGILSDGLLSKRISPRGCVLLGICLSAGGYGLSSLVSPESPYWIYCTYGLCVGLGIGLVYNVWLNTVMQWFPDHGGLASGLLLLGMGLSGVTTTPLMATLAQVLSWRISFRVICGILLIVGACALRFINPAPDGLPVPKKVSTEQGREFSPCQMLASAAFWCFAVWKLILIGLGQACSGQLAQIFQDFGQTEQTQLLMVSLFVSFNGAARLVWGFCCDRIGRTAAMLLISALASTGCALVAVGFPCGSVPMLMAGFLIIALCYGGAATLGANYTAAVFGRKHYRQNNGISAATCLPANLGATAAIGILRDSCGSYLPFFWVALPSAAVSVALAWACQRLVRSSGDDAAR